MRRRIEALIFGIVLFINESNNLSIYLADITLEQPIFLSCTADVQHKV